jgi:hypothetical protein
MITTTTSSRPDLKGATAHFENPVQRNRYGRPFAANFPVSARFFDQYRAWQRRRREEADFAKLTYLDRKDLGFPTESIFHPCNPARSDAPRGRLQPPALSLPGYLVVALLLSTVMVLLGHWATGSWAG